VSIKVRATYALGTVPIRWRETFSLPAARFTAEVDDSRLPFLVALEMAAAPRSVEITRYTVVQREGGPPITASRLRRVPLNSLVEAAAMALALRREEHDGGVTFEPAFGREGDVVTLRFPQALNARGRAPLDDKHFKRVASIYRAASRSGRPVTRAVAEDQRWGRIVPVKTAERWIRGAKDRGFL
jgi:hypothetical protein